MTKKRAEKSSTDTPLGLEAFDSLRAEDEPWLSECFVPPPNIEQIAGERSVIVFGRPGSGKTTLSQYLRRLCKNQDGSPNRLIVEWTPTPPIEDNLSGMAVVRRQAEQLLDVCVGAVLHYLAHHPDSWQTAPATSKETLAWFAHQYSQNDLSLRVEQIIEDEQPLGEAVLRSLLDASPRKVLPPQSSPDKVAARLIRTLNSLSLKGIWVIGNDQELEMWVDVDPDNLVLSLKRFFSTLPLFERTNFSYKILLPALLEQKILAVVPNIRERQRIFPYYLGHWSKTRLQELVNQRLRLAIGQPDFTLDKLCDSAHLLPWLEWIGDTSPREWLEQIKPLVKHYLTTSATQPIEEKMWYKLRCETPPRLYLDDEGKEITVGARRISLEGIPSKAFETLRFLYQQPSGQATSKEVLYYHIYLGIDYIPQPHDKNYEPPKGYENNIHNNILKLRKAIEPVSSGRDSVLFINVPGYGYKLNTRW